MGQAGLKVVRVDLQPLVLLTQLMEGGEELLTITGGGEVTRRGGRGRGGERGGEGKGVSEW